MRNLRKAERLFPLFVWERMKRMKRFAAILLTGIMSISAALPAFAAVQTNASQWAVSSMEYAYEQGIATEKELQKATAPMSRKEFCSVAMAFMEAVTGEHREAAKESPFQDCDDPAVIAAYEAGIIGGTAPGIFEPDSTLTREQMAIIIGRTLKVCGKDLTEAAKENPFKDTKVLFEASNRYIDQLYGAEIVNGNSNGTFAPFNEMTVQEAVVSFVRAYRYVTTGLAYDPAGGNQTEIPEPPEMQSEADTVKIGGKSVCLHWTEQELTEIWGQPNRVDTSVYGLDRYVYINDY